ncbi:MAG: WD40 repeat domain-containing protein [Planctomycetota bacterium]|jgi:WD40 repeat protein
MRRFWTVACCWVIGSLGMGIRLAADLSAQESASPAASVLRMEPLPEETESPVVTALAIAPQGTFLAAAGDDHSIRVLDPIDGRSLAVQVGHRDWVKCLVVSPGGRRLASCGHDGELRVWEVLPQQGEVRLFAEHTADHALFALAFASENELYAVGFGDAIYRLDIAADTWQVDHRCDCKDLRAIDISRDGRWLAYGGRDGIIRLHGLVRPEHALTSTVPSPAVRATKTSPHLHYERILAIRFAADGRSIYSCGEDRRLVQWDPNSNRILSSLDIQAGKLMAVCPLDDGLVAVGGSDNTIRIVDTNQSKTIAKFIGHDGSVAVLQRDATHLYSGGFDTTVRIWNIRESIRSLDDVGRFVHPISAQFEDSSSQEPIR